MFWLDDFFAIILSQVTVNQRDEAGAGIGTHEKKKDKTPPWETRPVNAWEIASGDREVPLDLGKSPGDARMRWHHGAPQLLL